MRQRRIKNENEKVMQYENYILLNDNYVMKDVFDNKHPVFMEIGCGRGQFINTLAQKNKDINYIGLETIGSVLIRALEKTATRNLENVRYFWTNADSIKDLIQENEVDKIYLNFSDPWPKKGHEKRRLTHSNFVHQYKNILKPDGVIEFKTDNAKLFEFTLEEFKRNGLSIVEQTKHLYESTYLIDNVATEYEEKFVKLGYNIHYLKAINLK